MLFYSPFEQFIIIPLFSIKLPYITLFIPSVYLSLLILILILIFTNILILNLNNNSLYVIPTGIDTHIFLSYIVIQAILEKHVHVKFYQQAVFPITFTLSIFLLMLNLSGNLPLFMSLTSHFAVISAFCLPTFFGIFFWCSYEREITFLRTFYAPGTDFLMATFLFPVEILTYFMRPISVICRLCANIMSGHVIIKVCLHTIFSLTKIKSSYNFFLSLLITILLLKLLPLLILEICVSLIQVYVFLVIFCIFLSDTFGHHYRY